ncbi:MAG: hypothetical protein Q9188_003588 [Gyalolechia gomerana]
MVSRDNSNSTFDKRGSRVCFDWPVAGEDANDLEVDPPVDIGYYPRSCGVHVRQYQKNEGKAATNGKQDTSYYRLTILLKDANEELVGEVDYYDAPGGQGGGVTGELPLVFIATTGSVDNDPIKFDYGGQHWDSSSGQCSVGKYDSGSFLSYFGEDHCNKMILNQTNFGIRNEILSFHSAAKPVPTSRLGTTEYLPKVSDLSGLALAADNSDGTARSVAPEDKI